MVPFIVFSAFHLDIMVDLKQDQTEEQIAIS